MALPEAKKSPGLQHVKREDEWRRLGSGRHLAQRRQKSVPSHGGTTRILKHTLSFVHEQIGIGRLTFFIRS